LTIGQCATLACLLEISAPKPGNVHRGADFDDLTFDELSISAVAIGPGMERASTQPVGQTVLQSIRATRQLVRTNTNLGIVLLLSPLAAVPRTQPLADGLHQVLSQLTAADSADVYAAIRLAQPGGLARIDRMDIASAPPASLLDAMRHAESWDLIARQYVTGFETVFSSVAPRLLSGHAAGWSLANSIVHAQLRLMAEEPDSLIARKCGMDVAIQAACRAASILDSGQPGDESYHEALADFDFWLRSDGHRRNPGTTADLIAAGLFTLLRDDLLPWLSPSASPSAWQP
jgi:triphosphoribosyl-dephospho-CoA synthase